jgi:hypothetical protein
MANRKHLAIFKKGVAAWNEWRNENPNIDPDLSGANLRGADPFGEADLSRANLSRANLSRANLNRANLTQTRLSRANLTQTRLSRANLFRAELCYAILSGADLSGAGLNVANLFAADLHEADLSYADLNQAILLGANLREAQLFAANLRNLTLSAADLTAAKLGGTVFGNVSLTRVKGLDLCEHLGPSIIDFQTLQESRPLPDAFLRGVGFPERLIEYLPSLLNEAIQHYSCFISYSSKDQAFAERVHADLQNKGVRCWFAPHDMPIGAKIIDAIDKAIQLRDKVLLILSEAAIASDWVEGEVTRALDEERTRKNVVLFPVRIDDAVMETSEGWARLLRGQRNIGDFTRWKEHDSYQNSFERLMRDLRVKPQDGSDAP